MNTANTGAAVEAAKLERAFRKYDADQKGYLTKLEFKCAFIYLTGL
jgi:hypothetical protein